MLVIADPNQVARVALLHELRHGAEREDRGVIKMGLHHRKDLACMGLSVARRFDSGLHWQPSVSHAGASMLCVSPATGRLYWLWQASNNASMFAIGTSGRSVFDGETR